MSKRMTAADFPAELLEIFDGYVHGVITKRQFLDHASKYAVGGVTALALYDMLAPQYALAEQVSPDDPAISVETVSYPSPKGHGEVKALMVKPAGAPEKLPAVLVVHENRGLNPYIADVARRIGKAGYLAFAPDGLTPLGGYPGNDDDGRTMQKQLDPVKLMQDFFAAFEHLVARADANGRVGAVGFCYGGGVCNALAVAYPNLAASVPFYGRQPAADSVASIRAPLLIHYAELDKRINEGIEAYEAALKAHNKTYTLHMYEGVNHGFHNDTTPRYDEAAATLAWQRTMAFFEKYLRG